MRRIWKLLGSADNKTPSQLNQSLSTSLTGVGKTILTIWAWDTSTTKWRFFAPTLEAQGGTALTDYISSHGYLSFNSAITAADGIWVNISAVPRLPVLLRSAGNFVITNKGTPCPSRMASTSPVALK